MHFRSFFEKSLHNFECLLFCCGEFWKVWPLFLYTMQKKVELHHQLLFLNGVEKLIWVFLYVKKDCKLLFQFPCQNFLLYYFFLFLGHCASTAARVMLDGSACTLIPALDIDLGKSKKNSTDIVTKALVASKVLKGCWNWVFFSFPPSHNELKDGKTCNFWTMHCLPQRLKSSVKFFRVEQPPKHTFQIILFSEF